MKLPYRKQWEQKHYLYIEKLISEGLNMTQIEIRTRRSKSSIQRKMNEWHRNGRRVN